MVGLLERGINKELGFRPHWTTKTEKSQTYVHALSRIQTQNPFAQWIRFLNNPMEQIPFQKITVAQLVKKFPAVYGTRRFITMFKNSATGYCRQPDQPIPQHPISFNIPHTPNSLTRFINFRYAG